MSDAYPLPPDKAAEAAAIYLAHMCEQYGFVECRVWPDRTAALYHITAASTLKLQAEYASAVVNVAARRQAELTLLKASAHALVILAQRDLVRRNIPMPLREAIADLEATVKAEDMTDMQYAALVLQLAAVGQRSDAFDGLDKEQLDNLVFLLDDAHKAAAAKAALVTASEATAENNQ